MAGLGVIATGSVADSTFLLNGEYDVGAFWNKKKHINRHKSQSEEENEMSDAQRADKLRRNIWKHAATTAFV